MNPKKTEVKPSTITISIDGGPAQTFLMSKPKARTVREILEAIEAKQSDIERRLMALELNQYPRWSHPITTPTYPSWEFVPPDSPGVPM